MRVLRSRVLLGGVQSLEGRDYLHRLSSDPPDRDCQAHVQIGRVCGNFLKVFLSTCSVFKEQLIGRIGRHTLKVEEFVTTSSFCHQD